MRPPRVVFIVLLWSLNQVLYLSAWWFNYSEGQIWKNFRSSKSLSIFFCHDDANANYWVVVLEQPGVQDPGSGQRAGRSSEGPASGSLPPQALPRLSAPLPDDRQREQGLL